MSDASILIFKAICYVGKVKQGEINFDGINK